MFAHVLIAMLAVAPAHLFLPALYIVGRLGFKNDR